jgi:hypothetical protein
MHGKITYGQIILLENEQKKTKHKKVNLNEKKVIFHYSCRHTCACHPGWMAVVNATCCNMLNNEGTSLSF